MRALLIVLVAWTQVAHAAPPEPTGPHPRMLLDKQLRSQWRAMAKLPAGPVVGAIRLCDQARTTRDHERALYQGSAWARVLQACLVAWAATDSRDHAATAIKYFTALLDDLDRIGDGRGGDTSAQRDHGYAIRNLGPYTALAYDWLAGHPLLTPELQARARQRWKAWLDWYREKGYRATDPGSNYHAGYLVAATTIAIAQAGEAGPYGAELWQQVADQMWGKEMAAALSQEGVLAGGNWPEGWQYGPLAVAEYALGARLVKRAGVEVAGVEQWLSSVLRHHVYSLSPGEGVYAGGDTEKQAATLDPHVLTLNAIALGDASPQDKRWARGELARLRLADRDWFLYDALAAVGDGPTLPPRSAWPTWYLAANTSTLYARTRWDDSAIWFVSECHPTIKTTDHRHRNAGNFMLSRGRDNVIVDPSPYGSQSTLTSNAPTVASSQLPADYIPSQGAWSEKAGYEFVTQRTSGVVVARCDYADAYKMQQKPSDIAEALRDFVLLPSSDGREAALLVIDRASTGADDRGMHLRFRTPGQLVLDDSGIGTTTVGSTKLTITSVTRSAPGTTAIGAPTAKNCEKPTGPKGQCDAARIPVTDYRVQIPGPSPAAVHLIAATGDKAPPTSATAISGQGWAGVQLRGSRPATVIWRTRDRSSLDYSTLPGTQVILDPPDFAVDVSATMGKGGCNVRFKRGGKEMQRPLVFALDAQCRVTLDAEAPAASAIGTRAPRTKLGRGGARSPRSGCCGAETTPGSALAMTFVVTALLLSLHRSRRK